MSLHITKYKNKITFCDTAISGVGYCVVLCSWCIVPGAGVDWHKAVIQAQNNGFLYFII